ncbi:hypothetical protein NEOLEDRAFT_848770 [Neolentinus lepideus HHB14362 ss-1]|uniref:Uncharacterized protein n=1 Tax=Neolentinus lepideus HHB14362 ss-1 TaxID=1314782 RepID=A0A165UP45_9AGAM|nr:hypothetical protein NEOLEDRAFT_848770 [Neolentinus lepideus HHB14362 ss-1]
MKFWLSKLAENHNPIRSDRLTRDQLVICNNMIDLRMTIIRRDDLRALWHCVGRSYNYLNFATPETARDPRVEASCRDDSNCLTKTKGQNYLAHDIMLPKRRHPLVLISPVILERHQVPLRPHKLVFPTIERELRPYSLPSNAGVYMLQTSSNLLITRTHGHRRSNAHVHSSVQISKPTGAMRTIRRRALHRHSSNPTGTTRSTKEGTSSTLIKVRTEELRSVLHLTSCNSFAEGLFNVDPDVPDKTYPSQIFVVRWLPGFEDAV